MANKYVRIEKTVTHLERVGFDKTKVRLYIQKVDWEKFETNLSSDYVKAMHASKNDDLLNIAGNTKYSFIQIKISRKITLTLKSVNLAQKSDSCSMQIYVNPIAPELGNLNNYSITELQTIIFDAIQMLKLQYGLV